MTLKISFCLLPLIFVGAAPAPAPQPPADLAADSPASVMTGTVEQRNATIHKALEGDARLEQLSMQDLSLSQAIHLLSLQLKIDARIDWDAMEKQGIRRDSKATLNLYNVTPAATLDVLLWQMRPKSGNVGYKIDNGVLLIAPTADTRPPSETDADKKMDADTAKKLKTVQSSQIRMPDIAAGSVFQLFTLATKLSVVVDWAELAKVDVKPTAKITLDIKPATTEAYLQGIIAQLKPSKGALAYDIRGGIVRISTAERLQAEAAAATATTTMP